MMLRAKDQLGFRTFKSISTKSKDPLLESTNSWLVRISTSQGKATHCNHYLKKALNLII